MSSQHLKDVESQGMKETMPETLDGTMKTLKSDINDGLNTVLNPEKTSANGDKSDLHH